MSPASARSASSPPAGKTVVYRARKIITLDPMQPEATHVAVAFDTVIESFRNRLFAGYKTGEGIDPALHGQFELAERVTRALGLVTWWGLGRLVRAFGRKPSGAGTDITVPAAQSAGSGGGPRSYSGAADPVRSP